MKDLDIDDIFRKNPKLDRDSLDALRKYLKNVAQPRRTRYRLAPFGTHRATTVLPDSATERSRYVKSNPGF
jgi:hypothetical protein